LVFFREFAAEIGNDLVSLPGASLFVISLTKLTGKTPTLPLGPFPFHQLY
jgi:hypothetical protein